MGVGEDADLLGISVEQMSNPLEFFDWNISSWQDIQFPRESGDDRLGWHGDIGLNWMRLGGGGGGDTNQSEDSFLNQKFQLLGREIP